jgi:defect-in-organelle-trafficking protein DotB
MSTILQPSHTLIRPGNLPFKTLMPDFTKTEIDEVMSWCWNNGVSDITIQSGEPIWAEYKRQLWPITDRYLDDNEVKRTLGFMYGPTAEGILGTGVDINIGYEIYKQRGVSERFRLNAVASRVGDIGNGLSMTLRTIPHHPPRLAALKLPSPILDNLFLRYGFVFIVGTTGSGKSTLLSSHVRERIEVRSAWERLKIIEYGQPIEFVYTGLAPLDERHQPLMPMPSQVEIGPGQHLRDFTMASPNAMRRASKVLILGEMRDRESMEEGMQLAITGHAVYATMHVDTPAEVFERVVAYFQGGESAAANKLLAVLRLVVGQKLVATQTGEIKAYRSWLVVDGPLRSELGRRPYYEWSMLIREQGRKYGTDFESQAAPDVLNGTLSFDSFKEVTGMAHHEAERFMDEWEKRPVANDAIAKGKAA